MSRKLDVGEAENEELKETEFPTELFPRLGGNIFGSETFRGGDIEVYIILATIAYSVLYARASRGKSISASKLKTLKAACIYIYI